MLFSRSIDPKPHTHTHTNARATPDTARVISSSTVNHIVVVTMKRTAAGAAGVPPRPSTPTKALLLLFLIACVSVEASVVGVGTGTEDAAVTQQQQREEQPPPPPTGDVSDAERALFASRSPSCAACQRVVLHLDETLLPRAFDEKAKGGGGGGGSGKLSSSYGRYEAMVEEEVSRACQASSIQLSKPIRRACEKMMEAREEHMVAAWYARVTQEDDWNMNWKLCRTTTPSSSSGGSGGSSKSSSSSSSSSSAAAAAAAATTRGRRGGGKKGGGGGGGGGGGACPDGIARLEVPTLDRLEQEAKLEGMRQPKEDRAVGTKPKYQSQPPVKLKRGGGLSAGEVGVVMLRQVMGHICYARL